MENRVKAIIVGMAIENELEPNNPGIYMCLAILKAWKEAYTKGIEGVEPPPNFLSATRCVKDEFNDLRLRFSNYKSWCTHISSDSTTWRHVVLNGETIPLYTRPDLEAIYRVPEFNALKIQVLEQLKKYYELPE